jgi:putative ABC transport system substrate-binding protein
MILLLSLLVVPLTAETQPVGKIYRLGILSPAAVPAPAVAAIPNLVPMALRELGYVEGENLVIERRFAEGQLDRLRGLAHELVQRHVEGFPQFWSKKQRSFGSACVYWPL